ncbi:MAG: hypothetical protein IPM79_21400 [Polyangiaceae bacterium]|jgi:hypothetical protein|nr:hypothetical protein [Polyangiaceae bacterium]MBK8940101.1 hypothetical protein [Polyangiaceae bacterium]
MTTNRTLLACAFALSLAACGDSTGTGGTGGAPAQSCEPALGCPEVASECVAFVDNTGLTSFALRITQLNVSAPSALTDPTVTNLLNTGIVYDYPECTTADGLPLFAKDGTFNWILELDTMAGTLKTGGAELETDPNAGYCFLSGDIAGFDVAPLETSITISGSTFETSETRDVVVPIFTDVDDPSKVILLPLRSVRIYDSTISSDNNCIGNFNGDELDPNNLCLSDADTPTFESGGSLEGYVTLEEADQVLVPELGNASLCALIAGADFVDQATNSCRRTAGEIDFQGDWCAGATEADPGTPATAECADAVQLSAGFAASAVAVRTDCN